MKQKVLVFEPKKCIGCRLCELICSMTHFKVTNPTKSRIRIIRDDEMQLDRAIYCHFCVGNLRNKVLVIVVNAILSVIVIQKFSTGGCG